MSTIFHRLLFTLAGASDNDLRRQIQFIKAENQPPSGNPNPRGCIDLAFGSILEQDRINLKHVIRLSCSSGQEDTGQAF